MDRIVSLRSTIKLFLVIALSLALSCVTAPGIRTSDVAELHYGDREEAVVEKLGDGAEVLYFGLDRKQYRYRLYATQYTKDVYALLFMDGELVAVHDEKQDFSECLNFEAGISWEHCLSDRLAEMRFHDISLGSHDFSHGIKAEQKEQAERDKMRAGAIAVAVPISVVLPGFVPLVCISSCGEGCKDPGARPEDYQDSCINKLASTLGQAINMLHGNITYESIDKALGQIQHHKIIIYDGAIDEKTIDDNAVIGYSWGCFDSYSYSHSHLSIKLGLTDGLLKWSWFKLGAGIKNKESHNAWRLSRDVGTYCPNADLGHADAQTYVGDLYYLGSYDLEKNLIQAFVWYSLAAKNGNTYASVQLEKVVNELPPVQLVEAQHRLEEWQPGRCDSDLREAISKKDE